MFKLILLICLFMPAILSVGLYEKLARKDLRGKGWMYRFCLSTVLINLFCFLIKRFVLQTGREPIWDFYTDMLPSVAANYLIITLPAAVLLAVVPTWLEKNVRLKLEDDADEDNSSVR